MCTASNKWEQEKVWKERVSAILLHRDLPFVSDASSCPLVSQLRPVIMNPLLMTILGSPVFLWNALGVPLNQVRPLKALNSG